MSAIVWLETLSTDMNLLEALPLFKRIKDNASKQKNHKVNVKSSQGALKRISKLKAFFINSYRKKKSIMLYLVQHDKYSKYIWYHVIESPKNRAMIYDKIIFFGMPPKELLNSNLSDRSN